MGVETYERQLDSFDPKERRDALEVLVEMVEQGQIELPRPGYFVNMHYHTFYSFNGEGYSPTRIAWKARKMGLAAAGSVDFDTLDALEEFREAGIKLGLKTVSGFETRVFVPEFAKRVINSPGEPGIAYHMGVGFASSNLTGESSKLLQGLKTTAQNRNMNLLEKVNSYLSPVELDYENDVMSLSPSGNPTERHICSAYMSKAELYFDTPHELAEFWSEKLGVDAQELNLPNSPQLANEIRKKTMKRGGVGYVQPDPDSFPNMADVNEFILASGGIPVLTWLDGTSEGEQDIEELLEIAMATGVEAVNIIPDRNYTPGEWLDNGKCRKLYEFVGLANKLDLPILVGTEMNSPGQKFVDDFGSKELASLVPSFYDGAMTIFGHCVLIHTIGIGYTGGWSEHHFENRADKNKFFLEVGKLADPATYEKKLKNFDFSTEPEKILKKLRK
jgi:hypothetical protein